jgi:hypothetical protein
VGSRAGLDGCGKSGPHRDSIPGTPSPQRVAVVANGQKFIIKNTRYMHSQVCAWIHCDCRINTGQVRQEMYSGQHPWRQNKPGMAYTLLMLIMLTTLASLCSLSRSTFCQWDQSVVNLQLLKHNSSCKVYLANSNSPIRLRITNMPTSCYCKSYTKVMMNFICCVSISNSRCVSYKTNMMSNKTDGNRTNLLDI